MSFFDAITELPEDPIVHLPIAFAADPRPQKVNLGVGTYKDSDGQPLVLSCVKQASTLINNEKSNKEYQPIDGNPAFIKANAELIFGKSFASSYPGAYFGVQALGGTGALRVGAEFLAQETSKTIFIPNPTWPNHKLVFTRSGLKVHGYSYYDENTHQINFASLCSDISQMPPGSTILLHAGCHNPTGIDPTMQQWHDLSTLIKKQKILPFFDFAYQGFADSTEKDAEPIRYFAAQGHEMLVANSFSKSMGLYGERVGGLSILGQHPEGIRKVSSQIKQIIRANYSTPPLHGMQIARTILQSDELRRQWLEELDSMRRRLVDMRLALLAGLESHDTNKDWSFIKRQKGFFSFLGLTREQVQRLLQEFAIHMPANGRINVAGLTKKNLDYVIGALIAVNRS